MEVKKANEEVEKSQFKWKIDRINNAARKWLNIMGLNKSVWNNWNKERKKMNNNTGRKIKMWWKKIASLRSISQQLCSVYYIILLYYWQYILWGDSDELYGLIIGCLHTLNTMNKPFQMKGVIRVCFLLRSLLLFAAVAIVIVVL